MGQTALHAEVQWLLVFPSPLLCRKGVLQQLTSEHHGGILLEKGVIEDLLLWASR